MSDRPGATMRGALNPGVERLEARGLLTAAYVPHSPTAPFPTVFDLRQHAAAVRLAEHHPRIAFVGDSLAHNWQTLGAATWRPLFARRGAADFGVGGDQTGNVLWRWENGEFPRGARSVVLQVGDNNFGDYATPEGVAAGIGALAEFARRNSPRTRVVVIGELPFNLAGFTAATRPFFQQRGDYPARTNALLVGLPGVKLVDPTPVFTNPDGSVDSALFLDGFHPNAQGYRVLGRLLARSAPEYFA